MSKLENQLETVRKLLAGIERKEWTRIAADVGIDVRTLDNIVAGSRGSNYDTVFSVYSAIRKIKPKARAK